MYVSTYNISLSNFTQSSTAHLHHMQIFVTNQPKLDQETPPQWNSFGCKFNWYDYAVIDSSKRWECHSERLPRAADVCPGSKCQVPIKRGDQSMVSQSWYAYWKDVNSYVVLGNQLVLRLFNYKPTSIFNIQYYMYSCTVFIVVIINRWHF